MFAIKLLSGTFSYEIVHCNYMYEIYKKLNEMCKIDMIILLHYLLSMEINSMH